MSKTLSFYNLTGGLNTVQDLATINSTPNRTESPDMMNIEYYKLGGIQVMKGNTQFGNQLPNKVTCGYEYIIGNNSYMIVTTEANKVYEYDKTSKQFVDLSTHSTEQGWSVSGLENGGMISDPDIEGEYHPRHSIIGYDNGVVIVNGYSALYYNKETKTIQAWIPRLVTADTKTITFHPSCIASYKGRLFMGANSAIQGENEPYAGGMLFYSGVGLGTQLTWNEAGGDEDDDAGAFAEFFEDTSYFTGLGVWAEYLAIHKEQNTYLLDGTANLSDNWVLKPYSEYTVPSQQSFVVANNGYFTYVPEAGGIYPLLTRTIYNNTLQGTELSFKIKDTFNFLDTEKYNEIYATFNPRRKQILFYMPMIDNIDTEGEQNGSGDCFIFDIQTKTWLRRKVPQNVTCAFKFNNETYIGTIDGKILQEFKGKTFDGEPISFYYLTPPFIWGGGTNKTTTKEFRIKMLNSSANHFRVESFNDGNLQSREKRLIKNVNDNLGGLIWDIDYNYGTLKEGSSTVYTALGDYNPNNFTYDEVTGEYTIKTEPTIMYPYTYNGTTYYTPSIITSASWNVPVFNQPDTEREHFVGYNQNGMFYILGDPVTQQESNYSRYEVSTSYAWIQYNPVQECYRKGNYYAWVKDGTCVTNLVDSTKTETDEWQSIKAFQIKNWSSQVTNITGVSFHDYNASWNTPNVILYAFLRQSDGNWIHSLDGNEVFVNTNTATYYSGGNWTPTNGGRYSYIVPRGSSVQAPMGYIAYPMEQYDKVVQTSVAIEVPKGKQPDGKTKSYTQSGNTITINVTGVGNITLTRYPAEDRGQIEGNIVYTKVGEPVPNTDKAYTTQDFSDSGATITAKVDDTITTGGLTYYKYEAGNANINTLVYYDRVYVLDDTYRGQEIPSTKPIYPYKELVGDPKSLTDTIWDYSDSTEYYEADLPTGYDSYDDIPDNLKGDAWLQQGYQTKRLLLPNQYFETVQFKFSGEGEDDSICISGFEVDGIQLAETPWS